MKATPDDLATMRAAIEPLDTADARAAYREGRYPRASVTRDPDKRYRWDLLWAARLGPLVTAMYDRGCKDSHIDTALRAIVPPLTEGTDR